MDRETRELVLAIAAAAVLTMLATGLVWVALVWLILQVLS
jgi:hypothetical protein